MAERQLTQRGHGEGLAQQVRAQKVRVVLVHKNSELRTHVLANSQSQSESVGRKMGLSGPGVWLSCVRE